MNRLLIRAAAIMLATALPAAAMADTYEVNLVVFLQGGAEGEAPLAPVSVDTSRARDPADVEGLHASGIHVLPDGAGGLSGVRHSLQLSGHRYEVVEELSWLQDDPPSGRGPELHLTGGGNLQTANGPVRALDGTVSLHGGFYLHLDTDLVWNQQTPDGGIVSWHLDENRRMRLNEVHYLDNARFGVIARVTKKA